MVTAPSPPAWLISPLFKEDLLITISLSHVPYQNGNGCLMTMMRDMKVGGTTVSRGQDSVRERGNFALFYFNDHFHRDVDGVSAAYSTVPIAEVAAFGSPLINTKTF